MLRLFQSGALQAKLRVSQRGDATEIEADRVADSIISSPAPLALQRKCACAGGTSCPECRSEDTEPTVGIHRKAAPNAASDAATDGAPDDLMSHLGPGHPLDAGLRESMETRFGHDFDGVRLHTDPRGEDAAAAVNARAFTLGPHVVFGAGEYSPDTREGTKLLAHELAHVVQQGGGKKPETGPTLSVANAGHVQRQGLEELGASGATAIAQGAAKWLASPRNRQFADDLLASVKEAPQHAAEILLGEVWEAIKAHWAKFLAVTIGLMSAEIIIGILTGAPEPTLITKVIAVILQVLVIAIIGYFAAVELAGVYEEGKNWFTQAREANGDPAKITEASRSFLRMVRHIILAILTVAGVRAKIRGFSVPGGAAAGAGGGGGAIDSADAAGRAASGPPNLRVFEGGGAGGTGPAGASGGGAAFDGAAARQLDFAPDPAPVVKEVPPLPADAPTTASAPAPAPGSIPGRAAAPAAGVAAAGPQKNDDKRAEEILHRAPDNRESVNRLATKSAEAEGKIGKHGVSAFTKPIPWPHSRAPRKDVEAHFPVHNTLGPTHRTIELPKPVTKSVADLFNKIFGRT